MRCRTKNYVKDTRCISKELAKEVGDKLKVNWNKISLWEFWQGMKVEMEHGRRSPHTDVTDNDITTTGKIALAHLNEFPDYYTRLLRMEKQAERAKEKRREKRRNKCCAK